MFEDIDHYLIELEMGVGAMRFASKAGEPTLEKQLQNLTKDQRQIYDTLKTKWNKYITDRTKSKKRSYNSTLDDMPDYMILRFARHSSSASTTSASSAKNGDTGGAAVFRLNKAWKSMTKYNLRYLHLTSKVLEEQLLTKVSVPVEFKSNYGWLTIQTIH